MGYRRRSREIALQVLFQSEFSQINPDQALQLYLENFEAQPEIKEFASELVMGISQNRLEIDNTIQAHSQNWKLNRMAFVDRNILRIAVFELKFLKDLVPSKVVIDEAIEIGKRFGSTDSSSFINGVLDNIVHSR